MKTQRSRHILAYTREHTCAHEHTPALRRARMYNAHTRMSNAFPSFTYAATLQTRQTVLIANLLLKSTFESATAQRPYSRLFLYLCPHYHTPQKNNKNDLKAIVQPTAFHVLSVHTQSSPPN